MRKLDRYIGSSVLLAILAVLGVIVFLALLFAFVDELDDVRGRYGVLQAACYVFLTAPQQIYESLPMASLIGCLVGLGSLASHSELTIMRSAGISLGRIVWSVMRPMLVLMLVGTLIGEYLAPWSEKLAQSQRSAALGVGGAQTARHGLWYRQGDEFVYINAIQPSGVLLGVTRYRLDQEHRLRSSSFAKQAVFEDGRWRLEGVVTTLVHEHGTEVVEADSEDWGIELNPKVLGTSVMDPDSLSVRKLWHYIQYLDLQGLNSSRYWLALWSKVLQPLVTAALVLMAVSFIFGPLRSVTLGQRVFTGVLVGFVFRTLQDLLGPSSQVFGFPPLLAVVVPAGICALAGLILLRRAG